MTWIHMLGIIARMVYTLAMAMSVTCLSAAVSEEMRLPSEAVPSFTGQRYEADVPDTLDLAERLPLFSILILSPRGDQQIGNRHTSPSCF